MIGFNRADRDNTDEAVIHGSGVMNAMKDAVAALGQALGPLLL
jgi:hypothetical protein